MVYLDYAATCPVVKYPQQLYRNVLGEGYFFNPNANYAYKEKRLLSEAENRVKKAIGAKSGKVVFGGTSSQLIENLFTHIAEETNEYLTICSIYEHDAMWRFADQWGDIDSLKHAIRTYHGDKQLIVCLMGVNNLTGEIFPVEEIGKLCHEHNAFYICDMTAMIGKAPIPASINQWCDCAVWSGHKLGTELGIGAMWISDRLDKWLNGFKLHGTPNLTGALAMTQAVEEACDKVVIDKKDYHWTSLADMMYRTLEKANINYAMIPDRLVAYTYAINAICLPGFNADALQQYLASKQIYVSIGGSACAELHDYRVLNAYGLSNDEASEVIRVSFGEDSSVEDVEALVEGIKNFKELYLK
jgi:cysteine desulfurase